MTARFTQFGMPVAGMPVPKLFRESDRLIGDLELSPLQNFFVVTRKEWLSNPPSFEHLAGKRFLLLAPALGNTMEWPISDVTQTPRPYPTFGWCDAHLSNTARWTGARVEAVAWGCRPSLTHYLYRAYPKVHCVSNQHNSCLKAWTKKGIRCNVKALVEELTRMGVRQGAYDGVISWLDEAVPLADEIANELNVPSDRRYMTPEARAAYLPTNKHAQRMTLKNAGFSGNVPFTVLTSLADADAAAEIVGFPSFLKPIAGAGMSAGVNSHLLSGRIDSRAVLKQWLSSASGSLPHTSMASSTLLTDHWQDTQTWILEGFLDGPEVFAETVMRRGQVVAVSLRATKEPSRCRGKVEETDVSCVSSWHVPALLTKQMTAHCEAKAADAARALGLLNGVFGIQMVADKSKGCAFLEANLRPHMWPMLFDASVQLYFQSHLWLYSTLSLVIASGGDPDPHMYMRTPAPFRLDAACSGGGSNPVNQLLYLHDWFDKSNRTLAGLGLNSRGCKVIMTPLSQEILGRTHDKGEQGDNASLARVQRLHAKQRRRDRSWRQGSHPT